MHSISRRDFLATSLATATAAATAAGLSTAPLFPVNAATKMKFGLVTYLWGEHWDLNTLIANCEKSQVLGVELRTTHAHGVEPALNKKQRAEVKAHFDASSVEHVGIGSNENFDSPSERGLKKSIEATMEFVKLSHDTGGSGVKVKPNSFHDGVERSKTIEQIGNALNEVGKFAADYGQEIRLEVHGQCSRLPIIKQIMDIADNPSVAVCWNSNNEDLMDDGLVANFNLVKDRFGATAHVREFNVGDYPYPELMKLFVEMDYDGWILMEARTKPEDPIAALIEQRKLFEKLTAS